MDFWRTLAPIWKGVGLSASLTHSCVRVSKGSPTSLWDPGTLGRLVRACSAFLAVPTHR